MDHRGVTLIEILVVMALIAVVAGLAMITTLDAFRGSAYHNERDSLIAALYKARSQAVSNICLGAGCTQGKPHGVYIQTDPITHVVQQYVIFQGSSYAGRDAAVDEPLNSNYTVAITGMSEVVFTELSGDPTPVSVGSITVSDPSGIHQGTLASVISTNAEGQIIWTN